MACITAPPSVSLRAGRLGYVSWLPADLTARTSAVAQSHVDAWIKPSHVQADPVADGGLDLAVSWIRPQDLEEYGPMPSLWAPTGSTRSRSVTPPRGAAAETAVLLDDDTSLVGIMKPLRRGVARDTGARVVQVSDGGVAGTAFFDHVRRCRRPIVNSPKGQTTPLPPDLVRRPVIAPQVYWTWSLVWRRGEQRPAVLAAVDSLTDKIGDLGMRGPDAWLPDSDPHKQ